MDLVNLDAGITARAMPVVKSELPRALRMHIYVRRHTLDPSGGHFACIFTSVTIHWTPQKIPIWQIWMSGLTFPPTPVVRSELPRAPQISLLHTPLVPNRLFASPKLTFAHPSHAKSHFCLSKAPFCTPQISSKKIRFSEPFCC